MKNVQKIDLGLTGYDELFMNDAERKENKLPRIYDVPISEIDDFPDHPFKVKIDEDMDQLVQSIKERGIITPVTLRPKDDGRYEIVSGHRRKKACELAGLDTVKAEVREMTRDEAIILMVESNLQRSTILPSEKAFSYKMRLEAMNRQGERADLTCSPMDNKLKGVKSASLLKEATGDGQAQVYRYIRLTELIPELLQLVDESRIAFRPAVELSYLKKEEQASLLEEISYTDATPSLESFIKVIKVDAESGKTIPYAGAGFQIYRPDGTKVEMTFTYPEVTTIDTFYTNDAGMLITPEKLEFGKGYSLVEVSAPYGYVLSSDPVKFDVTEDNSSEDSGVKVVEVIYSRSSMMRW